MLDSGRTTEDWIAADRRVLWHPFTQMQAWCDPALDPPVIVGGEGAMLTCSRGHSYFDGNSSIWTNIHGHCHPAIVAAICDQARRLDHASFLGGTNPAAIALAEHLVRLFPDGTLTRVFYSDDGSTAVEVALKMAIQARQLLGEPHRNRFLAFDQAYHGDTAGAASVGGIQTFFGRFEGMHFPVGRVASVDELPDQADDVTAVIVEPLIQGAAGMRLWPDGTLRRLRDWCDARGVYLILDEVMTGFGRTGKMFACEHEGVVPDFIALAKGLSGGTLPLAATLTTESIYSAFLGDVSEGKTFYYGHSYCGNPIACAAALANLKLFESEDTLASLQPKITHLRGLLAKLEAHPRVAATRQCGLIAGIDIVAADGTPHPAAALEGARVCRQAMRFGLLTRPVLDTIVLMPPLCATPTQLDAAVEALRLALD